MHYALCGTQGGIAVSSPEEIEGLIARLALVTPKAPLDIAWIP